MPLYNAKRWTILVQVSFMTINTILLLNLCLAFMADYQERYENEAHDWFSQMRHVMLNDAFDLLAKKVEGSDVKMVMHDDAVRVLNKAREHTGGQWGAGAQGCVRSEPQVSCHEPHWL